MNIILFDPEDILRPLPRTDRRAVHVLDVLRRTPGDTFDAGLIDGRRGKAALESIDEDGLVLSFAWGEEPPPLEPITLVVGMPRPQTARKVLEEATALGVQAMHFVATERGDRAYAQSRLWSSGEWRRHVIAGAEQAFTTRLPRVTWAQPLAGVIASCGGGACLALDNYEAARNLGSVAVCEPLTVAIGAERGWSEGERQELRGAGFELVSLGERVLRVETACVAALAVVRSKLHRM